MSDKNKVNDMGGLQEDSDIDPSTMHARKTMILKAKAKYMYATNRQISEALGLPITLVASTLKSTAARIMLEQQEVDTGEYIANIRKRALNKFSDFLEREDIKPETMLNALKFALSSVMTDTEGKQPDSLIFHTVISETGQIEQVKKKVENDTIIDID